MRVEGINGLDRRALDRARLSRDARFDGKFFIAVTSTRIYCRPICPSPVSKSTNVRYYATAAAAAEAGFRPCLRCRPEAAPGTPAWLGTLGAVRRGLRLVEEGFLDEHSVEELARRLGIGARHLHRLFVQHVGASPIAVASTCRLHCAKRLLDDTSFSITSIAMASGFGSVRRFNDAFRHTYGRAPRELRKRQAIGAQGETVVLRLAYRPPYDWAQLHRFLAGRAIPGVELIDGAAYIRTVAGKEGASVIRIEPIDGEDALAFRIHGTDPAALLQLAAIARRVFDLGADPTRIRLAFRDDDLLAPLVDRRPGLRIPGTWDAFECAVRAIVGQQVSVAGARTLLARLVQRAGEPVTTAAGLTHLFPTPKALATCDLSRLGLTDMRIHALKGLSRAVLNGDVDLGGPSEEVTANLLRLRGIGAWTAQYVALRALGEPDAFPASDLVLRKVAGNGHGSLSARELEARAEAWRPLRSYAAMHLWSAAADLATSARRR